MKSDWVEYHKSDKVYRTRKKAWRPKRVRLWLLLPLLLLLCLGGYVGFSALGIERTGLTEYNVAGEIDYKVYLKDNDYYEEKFLNSGMQYIANLISVIRVDFDYGLEADEDIDAHYTYDIIATTKATDKANASKVLYERTDTLKTGELQKAKNGTIRFSDNVDIDYAKYSDYLKNFRNDFGIAANCLLDLKMVVKIDGAIKTEDTLSLNIPLSDQTLDIAIDTKAINRTEHLGEEQQSVYVKNLPLLIVGAVVAVVSLVIIIVTIYYYATRYNGDLYEKALHKILIENDTFIVNATETIHELPTSIRVESFKELLDAAQAENAPVIFLEVIPSEKAYFIVNGLNTTYRYTLSRAYQEKMASEGQPEY